MYIEEQIVLMMLLPELGKAISMKIKGLAVRIRI
jgi:hypothetical protein